MKTFKELQKELQQIRTEAAKIAERDEKLSADTIRGKQRI